MDKNPRREKFFATATQLMSEMGYKAMTMRELATRLGCDKSNIYNYTRSKQELLDILLFEIADKFHSGISEIEDSSYDTIEKLKAIIRLHIRLTFENPDKLHIHVNDWKFLDEDRKKIFVKRRESYEKKIEKIVKLGINEGTIRTGDISFYKNCILSSLRWLYTSDLPRKKNMNPVEVEKDITEFIFKGLVTQPT